MATGEARETAEGDAAVTAAQETALKQLFEIIGEHFTAGIIVVEADVEGTDDKSEIRCPYYGGWSASLGLLEVAKERLLRGERITPERES